MREELQPVLKAIEDRQLPAEAGLLFNGLLDTKGLGFAIQETFVLDFKETRPVKFSDDYGASIVRLAMAFHNTYGGLIVFGVRDRDFQVVGTDAPFDVEAFNAVLTARTGQRIECLTRAYDFDGKHLEVLLVPRRAATPPVRLTQDLGKYKKGTLWVRDRHEVLEARSEHLPLLFSSRLARTSELADAGRPLVHRSLPPSPATIKSYLARFGLEDQLWSWALFSDQPRFYLHGAGGSGKSTVAFEFAKSLVEAGADVRFSNGEPLDYVIYLSAKETEFNSHTAQQQKFALMNFADADELFVQALFHSGFLDESDLEGCSPQEIDGLLDEMVNSFNGVIVLDDIDALSRRNIDTGEEKLFLKAARAQKRLRILYTLRYVPPYALNSAAQVPGLTDKEFYEFVSRCCQQFGVPEPAEDVLSRLLVMSDGLPLIIETIIGLRKTCSNYTEALQVFDQKGGDEARNYLYQREYDRLDQRGRARYVLAALALLNVPVSYRVLCNVLNCPEEQVRDALTEISGIFVNSIITEGGDTQYQISPTSHRHIMSVSQNLQFMARLKRTIEFFRNETAKLTPEEASIIQRMERFIRLKNWEKVINIASAVETDHTARVNPRFQSALGQAYAALGSEHNAQARDCFTRAFNMNHRDIYMMRAWFHLERNSGYSLPEARRICDLVIKEKRFGPKLHAEFHSKRGHCQHTEAKQLLGIDKHRATEILKQALTDHLESLWIGRGSELDRTKQMQWFANTAATFYGNLGTDIEPLFFFLESLPDAKHDVDQEAALLLMGPLRQIPNVLDAALRTRVMGLFSRSIGKLNKAVQRNKSMMGLQAVVEELDAIRRTIEQRAKS